MGTIDAAIEGNRARLKDLIQHQAPIKNHPEPTLKNYWESMILTENPYIFRRLIVCMFDVNFEFDRHVRGRIENLHFPLGHKMGLELICGTDIWCNRHCAPSRVRIRAPRGPRTGPEPTNLGFSVEFGLGVDGSSFEDPDPEASPRVAVLHLVSQCACVSKLVVLRIRNPRNP